MNSHAYFLVDLSTLRIIHLLNVVDRKERKNGIDRLSLTLFFLANPNSLLYTWSQGRKFFQSLRRYFS